MNERRRDSRYLAWLPVEIDTGDEGKLVLSRDLSQHGVLLASPQAITVGATVSVEFDTPVDGTRRKVEGTVVRTSEGEDDVYPYRMAVEFDEPVPGLQEILERAVSSGRTTD